MPATFHEHFSPEEPGVALEIAGLAPQTGSRTENLSASSSASRSAVVSTKWDLESGRSAAIHGAIASRTASRGPKDQ